MKTIFYIITFCFCIQYNTKAQFNSYQLDEIGPGPILQKNSNDGLKPVYFNFTKRRLYSSSKMPLNAAHFLESCRGINDPNIQFQIRRYDKLTSNKKKLVAATIICGVGGYVTFLMSAAYGMSSYANDRHYIGMAVGGAALLATPFLAISTSVPHQKRKEILFHDLPEAYNFHVTSQNNQ
jgi:hypothetical protein